MNNEIRLNEGLAPVAFLYGIGVGFRNLLFNWGILTSKSYPIPLICVGNLTVGGTGKTPHVEYLIRLLKKSYRVAVLSRGYKRKSKGFILAGEGSRYPDLGDEPFQIWQKFPDILVAVDANRRRGIERLLALPEERRPQVILLDDAFQHRYVSPSLNIVLTDYHRLYYEDRLFPVGLLREPASSIRRTDIVVVTKCEKDLKPIEYRIIEKNMALFAHQQLFFSRIAYKKLQPVFPDECVPRKQAAIQKEESVLLVSGIANPLPLVAEVKKRARKVKVMNFADHHSFDKRDIEKIIQAYDAMGSSNKILLVTEKDAARLKENKYLPEKYRRVLYYLPITIDFHLDRTSDFDMAILRHVQSFPEKQSEV
ncbi:tetraacyldisaccharide 4'-kinase [Parabacteroides sp. Marseille-P3160]|uniref:tetraacyldisaccharide 4'-kinase n=1 Tax=Parabacteroides sp. Marseille-P3160 TaxID=1917887 RepID=UPI0009BC72BE|nr:tetraacyldisaccharide 4'-kinase [Parabacteroides sp. Marseille-P3160]